MDTDPRADINAKKDALSNSFVVCIRLGSDFAKIISHAQLLETCKVAAKAVSQFQTAVDGTHCFLNFSNQNRDSTSIHPVF